MGLGCALVDSLNGRAQPRLIRRVRDKQSVLRTGITSCRCRAMWRTRSVRRRGLNGDLRPGFGFTRLRSYVDASPNPPHALSIFLAASGTMAGMDTDKVRSELEDAMSLIGGASDDWDSDRDNAAGALEEARDILNRLIDAAEDR